VIILLTALSMNKGLAQTFIGGAFYQDKTLTEAESPYIVTENIIVAESYVLTVEAGVEVLFEEEAGLRIIGTIRVLGTEEAPVYFDAREATAERWSGITLLEQSEPDTIPDLFQNAYFSKTSGSVITTQGRNDVVVEHCSFFDNLSYTIKLLYSSNAQIINNNMRNGAYGIYVSSSNGVSENILIAQNTIRDFFSVGIFVLGQDKLTANNIIRDNTISGCLYGIQIDGGEKTHSNRFLNNILYDNEVGMFIYNGYNTIITNTLFDNNYGIRIEGNSFSGGKNNLISKNILHENKEGIFLEDKSVNNTIDSNLVYQNRRGLYLSKGTVSEAGGNTVINNTFFENDTASVVIDDAPQDSIAYNSFTGTGTPDFYLRHKNDQLAENNWWGTADSAEISFRIFDKEDDTALGKVLFAPYLSGPQNIAVPPPVNPVKQMVHDTLRISWESPANGDVAGYRVYYRQLNRFHYEEVTEILDTTFVQLPGNDILEDIAVTAVNSEADGDSDQHEMNESWFVMAQMYPFAGKDTVMCEGEVLSFENATAFEYDSLRWTTGGAGNILSEGELEASYVHDQSDVGKDIVFRLLQYDSTVMKSDSMVVSFSPLPALFPGKDTTIYEDSVLFTENTTISYADSIRWSTAGDGYFEGETEQNTNYHPGEQDAEEGEVTLILSAFSHCGAFTDTLKVTIVPTYTLSGTVHYNGLSAGRVNLYADGEEAFRRVAGAELNSDKAFFIPATPQSYTYLLYVPGQGSGYLPTYYVNKTHWEDAYQLMVDADVYDLDIHVQEPHYQLPQGEASLSGTVAVNTPNSGTMPLIHLTDSAGRILRWMSPKTSGVYQFENLPFGHYRVGVEMPGVPYFLTDIVTLSPQTAAIENIQITIDGKEVKYTTAQNLVEADIFPAVVDEILHIRFRENTGPTRLKIVGMDGSNHYQRKLTKKSAGEQTVVFLGNLAGGIYLVQIIGDDHIITGEKIIKR